MFESISFDDAWGDTREQIKGILGRDYTDEELVLMTGYSPEIGMNPRGTIGIIQKKLTVIIGDDNVLLNRKFYRDDDGKLICINSEFNLKRQGTGQGTKMFSNQISYLTQNGFDHVETHAAKSGTQNGYYTWPRLGYDQEIRPWVKSKLPDTLKDATSISDLMKTQEGRDWWKANGISDEFTFDLTDGSQSLDVLNRYMTAKGYK